MRILIAPNAFKNSLPAADAAEAIKEGLLESKLECECICFPVGDGGDGTAELIVKHGKGITTNVEVHNPLGRIINTEYGLIDSGKTAVIEMANASGLRLLKPNEYDPLHASSFGTGEMMKHALDNGVDKIILCIGGSATVDGGTGILQALGVRFLDKNVTELKRMPEQMNELAGIDASELDKRILNCKLIVLCDVENVLLGKEGAATIFGPQKGASPDDVKKLDHALTRLRDVIFLETEKDIAIIKHGGAAGGVAASLATLLNAELVNGIEEFLSITRFENELYNTDIVITGEGSIDLQTLQGKGPYGVAKAAKQKGIQVIGFAGKIPKEMPAQLQHYFDLLLSINSGSFDISEAMKNTYANLKQTAKRIGNSLAE
jgi:glycerate kinase